MEKLKNGYINIAVSAHGAELQSIRKENSSKEYLWQGNPEFWGRRSPILFPIVCGLWEGKYRTEGDTYEMGRHGFARDTEFKILNKTEEKITYVMSDNEDTLRNYPYHFFLSVTYRIENNKIHVIWHVQNTDTKEIHFQIGGHPAFNLPDIQEGESMKGCLLFDKKEGVERIYGNVNGCILMDRYPVETEDGLFEFNEDSFKDDAIIIDQCQLHHISLLDKAKKPVVTLDFKAPCVGLWSPYGKNAPFVCIEPWYGVHDHVKYSGKFKDKYLMNHLQPGASFMSEYTITID